MKIGITTFQRAHNFGAQMQMYALYNFLRSHGHDVWILDYHCAPVEDVYIDQKYYRNIRRYLRKNILYGIKLLLLDIRSLVCGYQKKKINRFINFTHENFQLTKRFEDNQNMPTDFDVLITGSDQLWNYQITKGRKEVYFLDNSVEFKIPPIRIAYAVSVEKKYFQNLIDDIEYVKKVLGNFSWVSVREKSLEEMLYKQMGVYADTVVDPSLFLSREDCLKIAIKPKETNYICVYRVNPTTYLNRLAKKIAKEKGLKVVYVNAATIAMNKADSYGPREIIGYICYADVVLTSSFHGTAFSVINKKNFYSAYDGESSRVQGLLEIIGLNNRFLSSYRDYHTFSEVEFKEEKLESYIKHSKKLLLNEIDKFYK